MQYTYEEAVRELSDFLGKHVTADNYLKMEKVLLTVLRGDEEALKAEYKAGQEDCNCSGATDQELDESYQDGYEAGLSEGKSYGDDNYQSAWEAGYDAALSKNF